MGRTKTSNYGLGNRSVGISILRTTVDIQAVSMWKI